MGTESHSSHNEGSIHLRHPRRCLRWLRPHLRRVQCRSSRTPGAVDLCRVDRGADRDPHLPSLPSGCRCCCLRGGILPILGRHGGMPLPCFHRSQRRLPAPRSLQGEERPRRLDLRRLHCHHDQGLRLHGGARYYRTGNRNPPRRVLLRSCWPHSRVPRPCCRPCCTSHAGSLSCPDGAHTGAVPRYSWSLLDSPYLTSSFISTCAIKGRTLVLLKSLHPFLTDTLSFILQLRLIPSYGFGQLTFE